ncbi:hypothetical protein EfmE4453_2821, partial [Enterococcus faecium E4453]
LIINKIFQLFYSWNNEVLFSIKKDGADKL